MTNYNKFIAMGVGAGFGLVGRKVKIVATQEFGRVSEIEINSDNLKGYVLIVRKESGLSGRFRIEDLEFLNNGATSKRKELK